MLVMDPTTATSSEKNLPMNVVLESLVLQVEEQAYGELTFALVIS